MAEEKTRDREEEVDVEEVQEDIQEGVKRETVSEPTRTWRTTVFQVWIVVAMAVFLFLAILALTPQDLNPFDVPITRGFQTFSAPWFATLMYLVSWPGYGIRVVIMVLLVTALIYFLGLRWEAVAALSLAMTVQLVNTLIKTIIGRPRPSADLVETFTNLTSFSFPSGHVMFYTAFFGFLFFLVFTLLRSSFLRVILLIFLGLLILLVGPSRVYLGAHWATDVLGGYLLGSLMLILGIRVYHWGEDRFFVEGAAKNGGGKA